MEQKEVAIVAQEFPTAVIRVEPERDTAVQELYQEGVKLQQYAQVRVITCDADLEPVTDDLALIGKVLKAVKEKQKEYIGPIKAYLDKANDAFKKFTAPLVEADAMNRDKMKAYKAEIDRKRAEAEAIEEEKLALARREVALRGGEITIDRRPVDRPAPAPARVHTELGSSSFYKLPKWELVDKSLVPAEYLMVDATKVTAVVKASKGTIVIPGIRIWVEDNLRVTPK